MTTHHEVSNKRMDWDGNGLPPVGARVLLRYMYDSKTVCHIVTVKYASATYCIGEFHGGSEHCFRIGEYQYEMVETPEMREKREAKELAVNEMYTIVPDDIKSRFEPLAENPIDKVLSTLYDAGYRKEIK